MLAGSSERGPQTCWARLCWIPLGDVDGWLVPLKEAHKQYYVELGDVGWFL